MKFKPRKLTLEKVRSTPSVDDTYSLVSTSVSNTGKALFLFVQNDPDCEVHDRVDSGASFPRTKMPTAKTFKLIVADSNHETHIEIQDLDVSFPKLDIFEDGRIVIVASRSEWRGPDDFDLNGLIYDPKTGNRKLFLAGDGIESLAVDSQSRIYISYFDEGVFGNFGWNYPGPAGPGTGGLCCFNDNGDLTWQFNENVDDASYIDDCYAMNVFANEVYIYYYSDFRLCKISSDQRKTFWTPKLSGCHNVAINDDAVLFSSQYGEEKTRYHFARFKGSGFTRFKPVNVCLKEGSIKQDGFIVTRADCVHYFDKDGWFRASLDQLLET